MLEALPVLYKTVGRIPNWAFAPSLDEIPGLLVQKPLTTVLHAYPLTPTRVLINHESDHDKMVNQTHRASMVSWQGDKHGDS